VSASRQWPPRWSSCVRVYVCLIAALCISSTLASAQQGLAPPADWQRIVRQQVQQGNFDVALQTVDARLASDPNDLEAHGWRGRVLAWSGRWVDAENEYRLVLRVAPDDIEISVGLADVLLWQKKPQPALEIVDRARTRAPADEEVLLCRARILRALARTSDLRAQLRELLRLNPANKEARSLLAGLRAEYRHELRFGNGVDTFSYTGTAQTQSAILTSRWNRFLSTVFSSEIYERFGEQAQKFSGRGLVRLSPGNWLGIGGAGANDNGIVPMAEASLEYGHGFRFDNHFLAGLESSYQQRWLWYRGAHILTFTAAQTCYLPHDFYWTLTIAGARSGFTHTGVEWVPSGSTRLRIPLHQRLSAHLSFAVGSETYALVDQVGRFSARTFAGGLQFHFASNQVISGYVARQNRSQNRSQASYGLSYGIRF
jgi:tetratricopeptide (TPR) repeat protein